MLKTLMIGAALAAMIGAPAMAQSYDPSVGSGNIVMVPVEIFQTSALIAKGHSLRVSVGASDLPQGVPPVPTLLQSLAGVLTIYSDAEHPSSVVIPVVPASALN